MQISLIIPTRNRAGRLQNSLARLPEDAMRRHDVELVLVDSASDDDTSDVIRRFAKTASFAVRGMRASRKGLSVARNVGAGVARGDLLVFTDDDCYLEADYFDVLAGEFDPQLWQYGAGGIVPFDPEDDERMASTAWWPFDSKQIVPPGAVLPTGAVQGANMFLLKSVFSTTGGFREDLGQGAAVSFGAEDSEYAARLSLAGFSGLLLPQAKVRHHHGRKAGSPEADAVSLNYDLGRGAYYAALLAWGHPDVQSLWRMHVASPAPREFLVRLQRELKGAADFLEYELSAGRRPPDPPPSEGPEASGSPSIPSTTPSSGAISAAQPAATNSPTTRPTMRILLATPTYDQVVQQIYHVAVTRLIRHYFRYYPDIEIEVAISSGTMIDKIRNAYASYVLNEPSFTHLLFIDSDMGFQPSLIEKMIAFDRPVVGCIPPRRSNSFEALYHWSRQLPDAEKARAAAQPYVLETSLIGEPVGPGQQTRYRFINGFVRVGQLGTGIILIKREVVEQMRQRFPELWVADAGPGYTVTYPWCKAGVLQCFAPYQGADGLFVSEDLAFCERWTRHCGGELWACINEPIAHAGRETFAGTFLEKLMLTREAGLRGLESDGAQMPETRGADLIENA